MLLALALLLTAPTSAPVEAPDVAIARALTWRDFSATLDVRGGARERIKLRVLEDAQGQAMRLDFQEPAQRRGMRFLGLANRDGADAWAIYLPALRRLMDVPLDARNEVVRDWVNLGLLKPRPELFRYTATGARVTLEGEIECRICEVTPKTPAARRQFGFDDARVCVDEAHRIRQVELRVGGEVIRRQTITAFHEGKGGPIPKQIRAVNADGELTEVSLSHIKVDQRQPRRVFTRQAIDK